MKTKLIITKSNIETLRYFGEQLKKAADELEVENIFMPMDIDANEFTDRCIRYGKDGNCSIIGFNIFPDLENIAIMGMPFFDILVDHPRRFGLRMPKKQSNVNIVSIDRKHTEYVKKMFPYVSQSIFLPLGGTEVNSHIPYRERKMDILYAGSNSVCTEIPTLDFLSDGGVKCYLEAFKLLLDNTELTGEEALLSVFESNGIEVPEKFQNTVMFSAVDILEQNARTHFRLQMIKKLSDSGFNVDIYGNNWNPEENGFGDNIHIHLPVDSKEINILTGNARISLNSMPWFKDGAHDRIYTAMLNRTVSVTDPSTYLFERFEHGKNIVFYDLNDMDQLVYNIKYLLDNPDKAAQIAENGYEVAAANDTWKNRLITLLSYMGN